MFVVFGVCPLITRHRGRHKWAFPIDFPYRGGKANATSLTPLLALLLHFPRTTRGFTRVTLTGSPVQLPLHYSPLLTVVSCVVKEQQEWPKQNWR